MSLRHARTSRGVDRDGKIVGYEYHGWQHGWSTVETSEQLALGTPAAESTGTIAQDRKKELLMGEVWRDWEARTSFVPFAALVAGKLRWRNAVPSLGCASPTTHPHPPIQRPGYRSSPPC